MYYSKRSLCKYIFNCKKSMKHPESVLNWSDDDYHGNYMVSNMSGLDKVTWGLCLKYNDYFEGSMFLCVPATGPSSGQQRQMTPSVDKQTNWILTFTGRKISTVMCNLSCIRKDVKYLKHFPILEFHPLIFHCAIKTHKRRT